MRRLGYGGFKAHLEKMSHWFRAYKPPIQAYDPVKNSGKNVNGLNDDFRLGPSSSNAITDEEIRDLRSKIPKPGNDTDAIEDARLQAEHHVRFQISWLRPHIIYPSRKKPPGFKRRISLLKIEIKMLLRCLRRRMRLIKRAQ